jgi:hypothetical protein
MARLIRKTAKVSGSGGGKINVRGREWTKEDLRELKNHSREKTPAKTIAKLTKQTVGALRQKAWPATWSITPVPTRAARSRRPI